MSNAPPLPRWKPRRKGPPSADDRRVMSQRFLIHAREELAKGNRLQAGEKAWGAVAQQLKIVGQDRGWRHTSHRQVEAIGRQLTIEHGDTKLAQALGDAYHVGHENFYENYRSPGEIERMIDRVEQAIPVLEALQSQPPQPYTISDQDDVRRLRLLTGNNDLQVGDTSPTGFAVQRQSRSDDDKDSGESDARTPAPRKPSPTGGGSTSVQLKPGKELVQPDADASEPPAKSGRQRRGKHHGPGQTSRVNVRMEI